ncbi:DUF943 family protein [Pseudomonas graminis]
MNVKFKRVLFLITLIIIIALFYILWLSSRPVNIVAVHRDGNYSYILVENFPYTDKGKIHWWLKNKDKIKDNYSIPNPDPDDSFSITFWLFGEGYKELEKYDRFCFLDMKTKENCIEKDIVFSVDNSRNMGIMFETYDGTYHLKSNGEIVKYVSHSEAW